jgi:hypothetical protein
MSKNEVICFNLDLGRFLPHVLFKRKKSKMLDQMVARSTVCSAQPHLRVAHRVVHSPSSLATGGLWQDLSVGDV